MFNIKTIKNYFRAIKRANKENTRKIPLLKAWEYYFKWKKHLKVNMGPLNSAIPWINFAAIDYLTMIAHSKMKIFEYGSGGSTLFWANKVDEVYSVEHEKDWAKSVNEIIIQKDIKNVFCFHIEAEIEEPADFISDDENYIGRSFEKYVKKINDFPDGFFDIVMVDGRARPSCVFYSLHKIKVGGHLVLDNSDRSYYLAKNLPLFQKWTRQDFLGPVPSLEHFCMTTIFKRTL